MKELCRHFVVLGVGGLGFDGDGRGAQIGQQLVEAPRSRLAVATAFVNQPALDQVAHAESGQRIGNQAALAQVDRIH